MADERVPITYVNFHGKHYVHLEAVIERLRLLSEGGAKVISVDKLVEWLESFEVPEPM